MVGAATEQVKQLRDRGLGITKPDLAEKKPTYRGWSTRSLEAVDFGPDDMVGIMGGPLSDGNKPDHALVIIDLDAAEAVQLADGYLPPTGMIEGRSSKPRSHSYYLVPLGSIPSWAHSTAEQGAAAAKEKTGHPGPFTKSFQHRETKAEVLRFIGTGGQCVCPPSLHSSGERREWEGGEPGEPAVVTFGELWDAVCQLASRCGAKMPTAGTVFTYTAKAPPTVLERAKKYLEKVPAAVSGQGGHNQLFTAARALVWGFELSSEDAFSLLANGYNSRCLPPWSDRELKHKVEDAGSVPSNKPKGYLKDAEWSGSSGSKSDKSDSDSPATPRGFTDTDIGNGRRFVADHGGDVRYVADWGQWVVFDGTRWAVDRSETKVERLAKETTDRMAAEAAAKVAELAKMVADSSDDDETARSKAALKKAGAELTHAKKSQDMRTIRRMLQAARSEPIVCIPHGGEVFDTRRDLLNCPNGTVELCTGNLRDHDRGDYITRLCPTRYDPNANRTQYTAFLETTFDGKPAIAKYVREFSGYVVTGEVSDQTLGIFNGDGSNGKNVLVDTWKAVLGECEYSHTAAAELLVGDGWERHPTEKTGLRGARLVVCSETGEDGILDETKMKSLTGGDTVTARYMRGDFFQFEPTHKLVLLTNNRPRVRGTDHGVWRRLRLVPFGVRFWKDADKELDPDGAYPDRFKADPSLGVRLRTIEAAGVLADMVANAVTFYRSGMVLNPPPEVTGATAEYRADQDTIGQYFAARVREDCDGRVKASEFYAAFKKWWEAEGYTVNKVPGPGKFGREAKRKFHQVKQSGLYYAVRLLDEPEREDGRKGGNSQEDARVRARSTDLTPKVAPILPSSHDSVDDDDRREREAIAEFGGG